ncbi:AMP-binding protein [Rhodococcus sp. IEGM 1366]|uniref:class I adenylate-forming enzyme family protein n=1 Tax=Rhodococcus sp. IEGM 1366 TaxID=3082223 RepID=UPI002952FB4D|nr:AMP-binding protein [Rhodococcus sp. IEGM 1366]MDV8071339.1 AMP-binding protein [Rhodococcus sp. IEGM 1366]
MQTDSAAEPWVQYYPEMTSPKLVGEYGTMLLAWKHHVRARPSDPAVHYFDVTLTFSEIDCAAESLAAALQEHGLQSGDRLAIYLQNDPQWLVAVLAAWKAGAVPVPVNPMLREKELLRILSDSGAQVLVCLDSLYADVVAEIRDEASLHTVVTTHPLDMTPGAHLPMSVGKHVGERRSFSKALDWCTVMTEWRACSPTPADPQIGDVGALTYTSGTTGRSKGAMNLQSAMVHSSSVYTSWWDLRPGQDVIVGLAPVFHITGLIAGLGAHIISGAPIVLMHRFDAEETLRAIDRWRGTFMIGASTAFIALINHPALKEFDVSSLTKTPSGGAAVSNALIDRIRAATGWELRGAYGLTEATSATHLGPLAVEPPTDPETGALSVGVPVPGARVRIVSVKDGSDQAPGETGEIVVSGPMVVPGYWQLPEESKHAIRDGWLHTGDIGKVTAEGWLFVVDRIKDMINAGGFKIYPRDVEDVLYQHPAVREASVVGVPDEYRGETVKAFVSLVSNATVTPDDLIDFCRNRMAAYKYPRSVVILDELPKNASGKILRRTLRES